MHLCFDSQFVIGTPYIFYDDDVDVTDTLRD